MTHSRDVVVADDLDGDLLVLLAARVARSHHVREDALACEAEHRVLSVQQLANVDALV